MLQRVRNRKSTCAERVDRLASDAAGSSPVADLEWRSLIHHGAGFDTRRLHETRVIELRKTEEVLMKNPERMRSQ